jgi:hypothetical protein
MTWYKHCELELYFGIDEADGECDCFYKAVCLCKNGVSWFTIHRSHLGCNYTIVPSEQAIKIFEIVKKQINEI